MLSNMVLEKIFLHPDMSKIPLGTQSTAVHVFADVIQEIVKEAPNESVQSLLE